MLALSVLAARHALRGPAAKRSVSTVSRALGSNAAALATRFDCLNVSKTRGFSTFEGPEDDGHKTRSLQDAEQDPDEEQDHASLQEENHIEFKVQDEEQDGHDGEMSPLERLMRHSQQFQLDQEEEESDEEDAEEERRPSSKARDYRTLAAFKKNTFRRRGSSVHHKQLGRRAVDHLLEKDVDELNYEAELETVWDEKELKQRKFHQALRRELDRDRVCTNCGERGHRSRNCLLPRICSNCGNLGHTAPECTYRRNPDTVDEFLEREQDLRQKRKQSRKLQRKAAEAAKNPDQPRLQEIPTSEFNKRNESLRKELDAELDAYADRLEARAQKRKERKDPQKDEQ
jgi:hypothetical protein